MIPVFLINFLADHHYGKEKWKERIKADYQKTFSMPRKLKKQRRKELLLDWNIANYDPF